VVGEAANSAALYVRILEEAPVFLVSTRLLEQLQKYSRRIFRPETVE
jgi:hypothetical protein